MKKSNATKVTLRFDWAKDKRTQNLFLDFYPPITDPETGKQTRREFLRAQITPLLSGKGDWQSAKTGVFQIKTDTAGNKLAAAPMRYYVYSIADQNVLDTMVQVAQSRQQEIYINSVLDESEREAVEQKRKGCTPVLDYYLQCYQRRRDLGMRAKNWDFGSKMFSYFLRDTGMYGLTFQQLDRHACAKYREYLFREGIARWDRPLKQNTRAQYYTNFASMINEAVKDGYLTRKPELKSIPLEETNRCFLEPEELRALAAAPCKHDVIKRAALFSAFTGLRYGDLCRLTWGQIHTDKNGSFLEIVMQKTKRKITIPLTEEALAMCGESGTSTSKVFELPVANTTNWFIHCWAQSAKLEKHVTIHTFRHAFGTNLLANGVKIEYIQALMGHKSLATTQIYAKVLDNSKREAVNTLNLGIKLNA